MTLSTKDLLTLEELSASEFRDILDLAMRLKADLVSGNNQSSLKNKVLVMFFQKPSTRTRISFEVGMSQLGGHVVSLSSDEMQLSRGESLADTARTISGYADCIMGRVYDHKQIEELARHASIPVINGLSDDFHPCQTLADFAAILEQKGRLNDIRIAWVGDGNNVCNSMIYGAALSEATMSIATPKSLRPLDSIVQKARMHTTIDLVEDPYAAVKDADVVVTDTFKSIHDATGIHQTELFPKYQVNDKLMSLAKPDAIFMHCLPATRGNEVTASVIDGPHSVVWAEAEYRLYTQKALLSLLLA